jgi:hypothetical protein
MSIHLYSKSFPLARKPRVAAMEKSKYFVVAVGKGAATKLDKLATATVN